jgi:hypothetical protein
VCKLGIFWHAWAILKCEWNERFKGPRVPKKAQFTHEWVEYNVFLFDELLKGSKSLKTFKISLTFRFDKLWHLSKSVHIGENFKFWQCRTKNYFDIIMKFNKSWGDRYCYVIVYSFVETTTISKEWLALCRWSLSSPRNCWEWGSKGFGLARKSGEKLDKLEQSFIPLI